MSAEVTNWPERLLLTAAVVAVIALASWAMWSGWHRRATRESTQLPSLPAVPSALSAPSCAAEGKYIGTARSGDWMVRVLAHGLGAPGRAQMSVHPEGVLFERDGAPELFIPRDCLRAVATGRGIAGTVVEREGMTILGWIWGGIDLDSGFRTPVATDQRALTEAAAALVPDEEDQPA